MNVNKFQTQHEQKASKQQEVNVQYYVIYNKLESLPGNTVFYEHI